jgi:hypothetical protein
MTRGHKAARTRKQNERYKDYRRRALKAWRTKRRKAGA